jgi:hypothetical protein
MRLKHNLEKDFYINKTLLKSSWGETYVKGITFGLCGNF